MITSKQQLFSDDQAITATAVSTNVIDLKASATPFGGAAALNNDKGLGEPVPILMQVTEAFNTLTSLTVTLENSANSDLSSSTVLFTQSITLANLTVGRRWNIEYLPSNAKLRYLGLRYTVVGTNPTLGKIWAGIVMGIQSNTTGA
jgi:hypothetical protein